VVTDLELLQLGDGGREGAGAGKHGWRCWRRRAG
jgi:hypothetical protein